MSISYIVTVMLSSKDELKIKFLFLCMYYLCILLNKMWSFSPRASRSMSLKVVVVLVLVLVLLLVVVLVTHYKLANIPTMKYVLYVQMAHFTYTIHVRTCTVDKHL